MISKGSIIETEIKNKIKELEQQHDVKLSTTQRIVLSTHYMEKLIYLC